MGWDKITSLPDYISTSQISSFLRCPKAFEYRYILGMKSPPSLPMVTGSAVHASAEANFNFKLKTRKQVKLNVALDAYATSFAAKKMEADKVSKVEEGAEKDRGVAMAKAHYAEIAPRFQPLVEPELKFNVVLPGIKRKLFGFIDLIAAPVVVGGKMAGKILAKRLIRDTKTSAKKKRPIEAELSLQLSGYALAHKALFNKMPDGLGLDVVIAKKSTDAITQRLDTVRTQAELDQFVDTAKQIEKAIVAGSFPGVNDQFKCGYCGFRAICRPQASKRIIAGGL